MYLKEIAIKNIGPIDSLSVSLPFNENGDPKPIIFVGGNGSGKTILQSQIIDSFYELTCKLFDNIGVQNGLKRSFFKISGSTNVQSGKDNGFSILSFLDKEGNRIEYFDKVGEVKKNDFVDLVENFSLTPSSKYLEKLLTNISDVTKDKLKNEWLDGAYFYQPAYRYEEPFWKNYKFQDVHRFEDETRFSGELKKDIEIVTAMKWNKSFLMDLVLDFSHNAHNVLDRILWEQANIILKEIKQRDDIRFGIGPRGGYRVSVVELNDDDSIKGQLLPSIDNLSLGELLLLNLFMNIVRYAGTPTKHVAEMEGIVVIDEIDVHLHADLQNVVLPKLISRFPKIQFIISTHSPLFLLGMKDIFGENGFEIRNMPHGEVITTERFSEFEVAYEILNKTEKYEDDLKARVADSVKPILFVEGSHDVKYINKAAEFLGKVDLLKKVQILDANGFGGLDKIWKNYNSNLAEAVPQSILLLYDCDISKQDTEKGKVFKRVIQTMPDSILNKGIENLFTKEILDLAMKFKPDFIDITYEGRQRVRGKDRSTPEIYEVNEEEKTNLCDWICKNGDKDDFVNFKGIFDLLDDTILADVV